MKTYQEITREIIILEITRKDVMESTVYDTPSKLRLVAIINSNISALKWVLGVKESNDLGLKDNLDTKGFSELDELYHKHFKEQEEKKDE